MKHREMYQKLSRLQTRAYKLTEDIQSLVSEIGRDMEIQKKITDKVSNMHKEKKEWEKMEQLTLKKNWK